MTKDNKKRFPIQGGLTISWESAERAYGVYIKRFGNSQSLECLAERGGFGLEEFCWLFDGSRCERGKFSSFFLNRVSIILSKSDVRSNIKKE